MSRMTRFGIWLMLFGIMMAVTYLAMGIQFGDSERIGIFVLFIFGGTFMVAGDD